MKMRQVEELLLQSLEHEMCGVTIFTTAVECAVNPALEEEWVKYLDETKTHVIRLEFVCRSVGVDPRKPRPRERVVRHLGTAPRAGDDHGARRRRPRGRRAGRPAGGRSPREVRDHLNWGLIGKCAEALDSPYAKVCSRPPTTGSRPEDEHLYHTRGWCRELWIQSLGMNAVLPPASRR